MTYFAAQTLEGKEVRLVAQADETVSSSATLQDDNDLFFTAEANTNYEITLLCIATCGSATPNFQWNWTTLTGAVWVCGGHYADQGDGGLATQITAGSAGYASALSVNLSGSADEIWMKFNCAYVTAGTSGTVYFRWAQATSNATGVIRKTGSHLLVRKVGVNA